MHIDDTSNQIELHKLDSIDINATEPLHSSNDNTGEVNKKNTVFKEEAIQKTVPMSTLGLIATTDTKGQTPKDPPNGERNSNIQKEESVSSKDNEDLFNYKDIHKDDTETDGNNDNQIEKETEGDIQSLGNVDTWDNEKVLTWLCDIVGYPQYKDIFKKFLERDFAG